MNVLTPSGYVNIEDLNIGDQVIAYDINDGHIIYNILEGKQLWTLDRYQDEYASDYQIYHESGSIVYNQSGSIQYDCTGSVIYDEEGNILYYESSSIKLDCDGNPVYDGIPYWETIPGELIKTKEQVFEDIHGPFTFYRINDTWDLYKDQSVWANLRVISAKELQTGDTVYDDDDNDITVTSIQEITGSQWWRLAISGDHSYIADNLTLHNASRYWVGGGSNNSWSAVSNTNWGSTSGGADNASVPTSVDDVIFDGAGAAGNSNSNVSGSFTILSLTVTGSYTSAMTHSVALTIAGNWKFTGSYTITGAQGITISAGSTISSSNATWPNALTFTGANTKTLNSTLTAGGLFTTISTTTINGSSNNDILICRGGLSINSNTAGTAKIVVAGGTWTAGPLGNNVDISGSVSLDNRGGGFTPIYGQSLAGNTLRWVSGSLVGGALSLYGPCSADIQPMTLNSLNLSSGIVNLSSSLNVTGATIVLFATTLNTASLATTASLNVRGGITTNQTLGGSAKVVLIGGSWIGNATGYSISNNTDISGSITISGANVRYGGTATNALRWLTGSITTAGSTLNIGGSCILDPGPILWDNITSAVASTVALSSSLNISRSLSLNVSTIFTSSTAASPASWSCETLTTTATSAMTVTLQNTIPYTVRGSLIINTTPSNNALLFTSNNTVTRSILTLPQGATCNVSANFTRIDASQGRSINSWNGTITDCINVNSFTDKKIVAGSL